MKERPILFSTPMVKAILQGTKTQTRRVVKPQPRFETDTEGEAVIYRNLALDYYDWRNDLLKAGECPYGKVGDRLWVRETWYREAHLRPGESGFYYRADGELKDKSRLVTPYFNGWKPSIFMPRYASRITLEIKDVRVERLQDISDEDAMAEGVKHGRVAGKDIDIDGNIWNGAYRRAFKYLWDLINDEREYVWDVNPWVWVLEFERIK